jgi:hypothetical protein
MESMDSKKILDELAKERKEKATLTLNSHYYGEFKRICDSKNENYGDALDKLIKSFVIDYNPKFK